MTEIAPYVTVMVPDASACLLKNAFTARQPCVIRRDIALSQFGAVYGIYGGLAAFHLYAIYRFAVFPDTDALRASQRLKLRTSDVRPGLKVQIHIFLRTPRHYENRPVVMIDSIKRLFAQISIEVRAVSCMLYVRKP